MHRITMRTVEYVTATPREPLAPGHVVVHNHVRPAHPIGMNGFRVWIASPTGGKDGEHRFRTDYEVERCDCGWAPDLAEHYRVNRALPRQG